VHLGQGGILEVALDIVTSVPQLVQEYLPTPGFSPVLKIFAGIASSFFGIHYNFLNSRRFLYPERLKYI
jgi:hypothetical protein